jgi:hypothetical protein
MQGFNNDMGLDLLMNPKKKIGSDAISISSRSSYGSRRSKSTLPPPESSQVINIKVDSSEGSYDEDDDAAGHNVAESIISSFHQDDESSQRSHRSHMSHRSQYNRHHRRTAGAGASAGASAEEDIMAMKKELLYQFERMEKKGMKLPKKFSLSSNYDDIKMEYDRLKRDRDVDATVKLYRRIMMIGCSGLEWVNNKYNPINVKLTGWSDSVYESIDDYDEIFEELHDKYKGKTKMSPEIRLLMMLGGSAFMHHVTHSMFKDQLPGLDDILKQNPDLAKNLAAATSEHMAKQQQGAGNLFGSLGSMFSGLFGGGGGGGGNPLEGLANMMSGMPSHQAPAQRVSMKGPTNVDELLKEFENDRIEMMSTITESELAELAADDVSSINGALKKPVKKKKITLEI